MMFGLVVVLQFLFFKQKTEYELRISDWSSDVCSSDLAAKALGELVRHFGTRGTKESVAQLREAMTALARDPHPNIQSYAAALGQTIRRLEGPPGSSASD